MMEACISSGVFSGEFRFTGAEGDGGRGKRVTNAATRSALGWRPKYPSFAAFMAGGGKDFYTTSGLF